MTNEERAELVAAMREAQPRVKGVFREWLPVAITSATCLTGLAIGWARFEAHLDEQWHGHAGERIQSLTGRVDKLEARESALNRRVDEMRSEQVNRTKSIAAVSVLEEKVSGIKEDVEENTELLKTILQRLPPGK